MKRCSYFLILTLCLAGITVSQPKENKKDIQGTTVDWASRALQGFGMKVWLSNQMKMGLQAWDCSDQSCIPVDWPKFGWLYPITSNCEHLYVLSPVIGGKIDGMIIVDQGYNLYSGTGEFFPEYRHILRERIWKTARLDSVGVPNRRYCDDDGDGLYDEDDLDGADNDGDWNSVIDDVGADGLADQYEVSCDGVPYASIGNPDPADDNYDPGARDSCHANPDGTFPFKNNRDRWTENNGVPDHGEPRVDEDYAAVSDQDLYCSAIDTFTRPVVSRHIPLGIKCIQKSYAWDSRLYEAVIPFDYYFVNAGRKIITDVYIGFYADMDVGPVNIPEYQLYNYSAYMESVRTAYTHNPMDRESTPAGVTLLGTSLPFDSIRIGWWYCDYSPWPTICLGGDDSSVYFSMKYQQIHPNQPPTMPSDTRFLLSVGPFPLMRPGDTIRVSIALVSGNSVDEGPVNLRENAMRALNLYNRGYNVPAKILSPRLFSKMDPLVGKQKVELRWLPHVSALNSEISPIDVWDDSNKLADSYPDDHWRKVNPPCGVINGDCINHKCDENGQLPGGRNFTGFRLYRSEDGKNFALMREYLIPDTATLWSLEHIDSVFIDSNLSREKSYWYSVTTVGMPNITIVSIPMEDGGVRYDTLYSDYTESGFSENSVKVDVPISFASEEAGNVLVVPNPYKVTEYYSSDYGGWEGPERDWNENKRLVKFIRLPKGEWTLRIFTLVGEKVTVIKNTISNGYEQGGRWIGPYREDRADINFDLLSESGRALASGVYIFLIDSEYGQQTGKFVLIR